MATVTVTEIGVSVVVQINRDDQGDSVKISAMSKTDVPLIAGREMMNRDITSSLTPAQLAVVKSVLDFVESAVKQEWNIP